MNQLRNLCIVIASFSVTFIFLKSSLLKSITKKVTVFNYRKIIYITEIFLALSLHVYSFTHHVRLIKLKRISRSS